MHFWLNMSNINGDMKDQKQKSNFCVSSCSLTKSRKSAPVTLIFEQIVPKSGFLLLKAYSNDNKAEILNQWLISLLNSASKLKLCPFRPVFECCCKNGSHGPCMQARALKFEMETLRGWVVNALLKYVEFLTLLSQETTFKTKPAINSVTPCTKEDNKRELLRVVWNVEYVPSSNRQRNIE